MFGINQIAQTVGQTSSQVETSTLGQVDMVFKKDADAEASKRFWIGLAGGALVGFGFGYAARSYGWFL